MDHQVQDQTWHLPQAMLHEILSKLPEKDAARTNVLSKTWAEAWSTFSILSFSDTKFMGTCNKSKNDFVRKRKNFFDYVRRTLLRFHNQGLAIKEFKLSVEKTYKSRDVDLWLKLASESSVEVLDLKLPVNKFYILPRGVLEAKSLKKLVLNGGIRVDLAFMKFSIKFSSLRVLSLQLVIFGDEEAIEHLISHCPLLEYISLEFFRPFMIKHGVDDMIGSPSRIPGMRSLSISGLPKLKEVYIQRKQQVYIDAPNLEHLHYDPYPNPYNVPCKMDFDSCRNLRELSLHTLPGSIITNKWFLELFTKFPFLHTLKLVNCTTSEKIDISSCQLKDLELLYCSNLEEANIDAPNLLSCAYRRFDASRPIISFLRSSSQLEVKVGIQIDYLDLFYLRAYILKFKPQNVVTSLSLSIYQPVMDRRNPDFLQVLTSLSLLIPQPNMDGGNPDVLQVSPPPLSIKHLDLCYVPQEEPFYLPLVNCLLSSCCPSTISLSLSPGFCNRAFIEFLYESLMGRRKELCSCNSSHTKCWWHGLKNVKVTSTVKIDEDVDFKTMLDALPAYRSEEKISFSLEF